MSWSVALVWRVVLFMGEPYTRARTSVY
jgi:hypothetical protein